MAEDTAKCDLCKDAHPQVKCYCTETPQSLCSSCAVVHFLADNEAPHKPLPVEVRTEREACEVCKISNAKVICTCMYPWITYCDDCASVHVSNDSSGVAKHTLEPLYAKYYLQSSASLPAYYERQQCVEELESEVKKNPAMIDACIADVNKVAYELTQSIEGWRDNAERSLLKIKESVIENVKICCAQLDAMRYEFDINPRMRIDQLVQLCTRDNLRQAKTEMQMLHYTLDPDRVLKQLPSVFTYMENALMLEAVDKLYFVVPKSNKLVDFELPDVKPREVTLETDLKFKSFSTWCKIPSGHIIVCGGLTQKDGNQYSREALFVDPSSHKVRALPPMRKERCRHGTVYFKNFVYVFGGYADEYLKSCERFDLKEQAWSPLPDLKDARDCVSAAVWKERIYIVGYSSNRIEVFDVTAERMFLMPVSIRMSLMNLLVPKHCALVSIENGEMTIVMESEIVKVSIEGQTVRSQKLPVKVEKSWYSPCPPANLRGEALYFFTLEMELWRLHLPSSELKFVHSLKS